MSRGRSGAKRRPRVLRIASGLALATIALMIALPVGGIVSGSAGSVTAGLAVDHPRTPSQNSFGPGSKTLPGADAVSKGRTSPASPDRPSILAASTIDLLANEVHAGNSAVRYANTVGGIAYDPTENLLFVSGTSSNSVVAMSPATGVVETVAGPLPTGNASVVDAAPVALAFDSVDNQLFASDPTLDQIEIFNVSATSPTFSYYESLQLTPGTHPEGLLALSNPDLVYVADESLDQVTAIDPVNDTFAGNVTVGGGPVALAYDPSVGLVYVADSATADMSWFGAVGLAPGATKFPVKNGPTSIAFDPSDDTVWVANSNTITVVDSATRASATTLRPTPAPRTSRGSSGTRSWGRCSSPTCRRERSPTSPTTAP